MLCSLKTSLQSNHPGSENVTDTGTEPVQFTNDNEETPLRLPLPLQIRQTA